MSEKPISFKEILETVPVLQNRNAAEELSKTLFSTIDSFEKRNININADGIYDEIQRKEEELVIKERENINGDFEKAYELAKNSSYSHGLKDIIEKIITKMLDERQHISLKTLCQMADLHGNYLSDTNFSRILILISIAGVDPKNFQDMNLKLINTLKILIEYRESIKNKKQILENINNIYIQITLEALEKDYSSIEEIYELMKIYEELEKGPIKEKLLTKISLTIQNAIKKGLSIKQLAKLIKKVDPLSNNRDIVLKEYRKQIDKIIYAEDLDIYKISEMFFDINQYTQISSLIGGNEMCKFINKIQELLKNKKLETLNIEELIILHKTISPYCHINEDKESLANIMTMICEKWKIRLLNGEITQKYASKLLKTAPINSDIYHLINLAILDLS